MVFCSPTSSLSSSQTKIKLYWGVNGGKYNQYFHQLRSACCTFFFDKKLFSGLKKINKCCSVYSTLCKTNAVQCTTHCAKQMLFSVQHTVQNKCCSVYNTLCKTNAVQCTTHCAKQKSKLYHIYTWIYNVSAHLYTVQ